MIDSKVSIFNLSDMDLKDIESFNLFIEVVEYMFVTAICRLEERFCAQANNIHINGKDYVYIKQPLDLLTDGIMENIGALNSHVNSIAFEYFSKLIENNVVNRTTGDINITITLISKKMVVIGIDQFQKQVNFNEIHLPF